MAMLIQLRDRGISLRRWSPALALVQGRLSEKRDTGATCLGVKRTVTIGLDFVRTLVENMSLTAFLSQLWSDDRGQDIAEYAVILAVVVVLVVGTITALLLKLKDM
jgi:Flp pilus assembly pilin Flp